MKIFENIKKRHIILVTSLLLIIITVLNLCIVNFFKKQVMIEFSKSQIAQMYKIKNNFIDSSNFNMDKFLEIQDESIHWYIYSANEKIYGKDSNAIDGGYYTFLEHVFQQDYEKFLEVEQSLSKQEKEFVTLFDGNQQSYVVVGKLFHANDQNYLFTSFIQKDLLYQNTMVKYTTMLISMLILLLVITILMFSIWILNKNTMIKKQKLEMEELSRQQVAQRFRMEQEIKQRRQQVIDYQLMDNYSIFYNREYFYNFLLNMTRQNLHEVSMISIALHDIQKFILRMGLEYEQRILYQVKETLDQILSKECVVARVSEDVIMIVLINDDYREVAITATTIDQALQELSLQISISTNFYLQEENESIYKMYQRILSSVKEGTS